MARALDAQPPPAGRRVAVITNSGGTAWSLADLLADEGLELPELSATLQDELRPMLPPYASPRNPVDIHPRLAPVRRAVRDARGALGRAGEVDAVVPVLLQRSAADRRVAVGCRVMGVRACVRTTCRCPSTSAGGAPNVSPERRPAPAGWRAMFRVAERTARDSAMLPATVRHELGCDRPLAAPARPAGLPPMVPGWLGSDAAAGSSPEPGFRW